MKISVYKNLRDVDTKVVDASWDQLRKQLVTPDVRDAKDGKLWAPAAILGRRSDDNVESISCLVLDFDEGYDMEDFCQSWSDLTYIAHTTHNHTAEHPKWRAVFPLSEPVDAAGWPDIYKRFCIGLAKGCCDLSCSNPSRIYFFPSTPFPEHYIYRENNGRALSVDDAPKIAVAKTSGTRPGDDFNLKARWDDLLTPHGWRHLRKNLWVRPGKDTRDGPSAIADDIFYCFSSNAGIPANKAMSPFTLYTYLNFAGDFSAAARDLKAKGYGCDPTERISVSVVESITGESFDTSPLSQAGNAARFAVWAQDKIRYAWRWGKWLEWDGSRWCPDDKGGGCAYRLAAQWARMVRSEAAGLSDKDARAAHWKLGCDMDKRTYMAICLDLASRSNELAILPDELDSQKNLLCVHNGVLDLDSMELSPHDPNLMQSKKAGASYNPNASCPRWESFLRRFIPDDDVRLYIQRAAGYSLTGYTGERKFFFLFGSQGGNGKSTFMSTLSKVLGDYAVNANPESFMLADKGASMTNDIARLAGARLVVASEQEEGRKLAESLIKRITGNDSMTARFLHQEFFEFLPEFKLWMMGNHKPMIRGTDDAIWDRIGLMPFSYSLPIEERDPRFGELFEQELDGILAWAARGYEAYKEEGLKNPEAIRAAVEEYRWESDIIGSFLEDCTNVDIYDSIKSSTLYEVYTRWCKGVGHMACSHTALSKKLKERGMNVVKKAEGHYFDGIQAKSEWSAPAFPQNHWNGD